MRASMSWEGEYAGFASCGVVLVFFMVVVAFFIGVVARPSLE
jgi:hypothetical protein